MGEDKDADSRWIIHDERVVDDTRRSVLSVASVELPDGVRFEQYVLRVPTSATVVVLDETDRVLLLHRHRFVIDRWVWELPGGYLPVCPDARACWKALALGDHDVSDGVLGVSPARRVANVMINLGSDGRRGTPRPRP